jgi:3-deoxy-D-manno-octulosonic-acid transferase
VIVLDTMGELKDFYALATLTYVGPNHNVLEPLAFDKPVFVLPGWEPGYPSFPVYRLLLAQDAIIEVSGPAQLATAWIKFLREPDGLDSQRARIRSVLTREAGATERALAVLAAHGFGARKS